MKSVMFTVVWASKEVNCDISKAEGMRKAHAYRDSKEDVQELTGNWACTVCSKADLKARHEAGDV